MPASLWRALVMREAVLTEFPWKREASSLQQPTDVYLT